MALMAVVGVFQLPVGVFCVDPKARAPPPEIAPLTVNAVLPCRLMPVYVDGFTPPAQGPGVLLVDSSSTALTVVIPAAWRAWLMVLTMFWSGPVSDPPSAMVMVCVVDEPTVIVKVSPATGAYVWLYKPVFATDVGVLETRSPFELLATACTEKALADWS